MSLTIEKVFAACDAIFGRGIEPTFSAVRAELGDSGSKTTILKYVAEWRKKVSDAKLEEEEVSRDYMLALRGEIRRRTELTKAEFEKLLSSQADDCEAVEAMLVASDARNGQLQEELAIDRDQRKQMETSHARQLAVLEEQTATLQRELAGATAELERLRQSNEDLRYNRRDAANSVAQLQERVKQLQDNVDRTTAENAQLRAAANVEEEMKGSLLRKVNEMKKDLQAARIEAAVNAKAAAEVERLTSLLAQRDEDYKMLVHRSLDVSPFVQAKDVFKDFRQKDQQ